MALIIKTCCRWIAASTSGRVRFLARFVTNWRTLLPKTTWNLCELCPWSYWAFKRWSSQEGIPRLLIIILWFYIRVSYKKNTNFQVEQSIFKFYTNFMLTFFRLCVFWCFFRSFHHSCGGWKAAEHTLEASPGLLPSSSWKLWAAFLATIPNDYGGNIDGG